MQEKQDRKDNEKKSIRYRILQANSLMAQAFDNPHEMVSVAMETVLYLQILKFPIDYFTYQWLEQPQAIMSYIDVGYIVRVMMPQLSPQISHATLIITSSYIAMAISLFCPVSKNLTKIVASILKFLFLILSSVGFISLFGLVMNSHSCKVQKAFWPCSSDSNTSETDIIRIIGFVVYGIFMVILIVQSMLRFEFLKNPNKQRLLRDSAYTPTLLMVYVIVNEVSNMLWTGSTAAIIMTASILLVIVVFLLKDEHQNQTVKKIQIAMILLNLAAILLTDLKLFFGLPLEISLILLLVPFLIAGALQFDSFSIKFELDNINKWSTPALMIRYCRTMRILCRRVLDKDFRANVLIFGYVDVHRQKCEMTGCPYRIPSDSFTTTRAKENQDDSSLEIKRSYALIKKIYSDGCKISPVSPQLQLEYCIFLYDIGERDFSLKNLLLMRQSELCMQKYYKYFTLKRKIHTEICEEARKDFLDLVSQLEVRRMEEQLMERLQEAALVNLEFWSVLNEDHPDFSKLNDTGINLVRVSNQVRKNYEQICKYVNNERITSLYIYYLISIQNDQEIYSQVHQRIRQKFGLDDKIVLQDWSNSCQPTVLVSIEEVNHGSIIDLNSTCASMLGYEKYELINRHCKVIFKEEARSQIDKFLSSNQSEERIFYLSHKNGYLVKITSKVQNYNSMETGQALILTLNFTVLPYTSFFLTTNPDYKIVGMSPSNIALFGIQSKTIENIRALDQLLIPNLELLETKSRTGNCIYSAEDIFKIDTNKSLIPFKEHQVREQFTINFRSVNKELSVIEISLIKHKKLMPGGIPTTVNFRFQVQANLTEFKYISQYQEGTSYLRQFSQFAMLSNELNLSKSIKQYGEKITTLRLVDNIIQVIEENQQFEDEGITSSLVEDDERLLNRIARKDQEQIFQNKDSYNDFIRKKRINMCIPWVIVLGLALSVSMYAVCLWIYQTQNNSTEAYFQQVNYQSRIIGMLAKQQSYIQNYRQHSVLRSRRSLSAIPPRYIKNMIQLQNLRLKGSYPYKIPVFINEKINRQFLSDQFLLSYSNYAMDFINRIKNATISEQASAIYNSTDTVLIEYLIKNGLSGREFMQGKLANRQTQIKGILEDHINKQIIILVTGIGLEIIFGIALFATVYKLQKQKVKFLRTFLSVTELQILKFSAKTQKFLISLHMQDSSGQLDVEQEEGDSRKGSSTFAKKKRFKIIQLDKSVYLKILMIPLLAQAFFIHTFFVSYNNMSFMSRSITYMGYTASGDTRFYQGLTSLQKEFLGGPSQNDLSIRFLQYYRDYYDSHYITFGNIPDFHDFFTNIFMMDICKGKVQVPNTCDNSISKLSSNGSLLIFTDITVKTQDRGKLIDFDDTYYDEYEIMSDTHRLLTQKLAEEQKKVISSVNQQLINAILIWTFCTLGIGLIYGGPVIRSFLNEINQNKDMMTILPISIARDSPYINDFIGKILNGSHCY